MCTWLCISPTGLPVLPGSPRSMDRGEPGSTGSWTVVPPWWTGMMPDGPGWTRGSFQWFLTCQKTTVVNLGGPGRGARPGWTVLNRVDTVGPPGRTVKDRGAAGVDLGAPGWKKTSYRRPVDNALPTVLGRHDVCNIEYFFKNNQRSAMCCLQKTSAGMQFGYKSVLFILHFHIAGMNRGEPGRTIAPPWRTGVTVCACIRFACVIRSG